jgi:hypothetical protein
MVNKPKLTLIVRRLIKTNKMNKMKMTKESVMALIAIFALIVSAQFAFAQTDSVIASNTNVDSLEGSANALDVGMNQVQTWFTFNQEKKAQLELKLADLRLIQAKIAAKNGNAEAMQKALEAHNRIIEKVQNRISKMDGADNADKVKASYASLSRIQSSIETHEARIEKLKDILADENLTEEQMVAVEARLKQAEQNTGALKELQLNKKEQVKTKLRAVGDMTEEEINSEVQMLESSEGLTESQRLVAQIRIQHTEEAMVKVRERVSAEKQNGMDTSEIESQIVSAEKSLADAKALYAAEKYTGAIDTIKPVSNYGRNMNVIVKQITEARQEQRQERVRELVGEAQAEGTTVREQIREQIQDSQLVGNDRDEHGCIGSAGYSWCEGKNKCLRTWEESCSGATEFESINAENANTGSGSGVMAGNQ